MPYYAYILKSQSHATYYYGSCADIDARLIQHNSGKVRYTKGRKPWNLHYKESFKTRSEAYSRELFFKSLEGRNWLKQNKIID